MRIVCNATGRKYTSPSHEASNIGISLLFSLVGVKISCRKYESHNSLLWHLFSIRFT
jgi:hypothetical protein